MKLKLLLPLTGVPPEYAFMLELVDGQHMPLRVVAYDDKTGAESGRVEVTKIDRHPLDASLFEVPAGYTVIDAMQMIQAFAGGGRVRRPPGQLDSVCRTGGSPAGWCDDSVIGPKILRRRIEFSGAASM